MSRGQVIGSREKDYCMMENLTKASSSTTHYRICSIHMNKDMDMRESDRCKDQSTRYFSLHRTTGIPKSALVMRKLIDFEQQTHSTWTRNMV